MRRWLRRPLLGGGAVLLAAVVALSAAASAAAQVGGSGAPGRPAGLDVVAELGSLTVSLDWDDVDGAAQYWVRWRQFGSGSRLNEGVRVASSGAAVAVAGFGTWVVRVQACNDAGCGKPRATRFTIEPAPEPVSGDTEPPRLVWGEIDGAAVRLVFSEPLDPDSVGGEFEVSRWTGSEWASFGATGDVAIDRNMVTFGLGEGSPRATAGGQYRARYLWDPAGGAGALRDMAGNQVSAHETLPQGWQTTRQLELHNMTAAPPSVTEVAVTSDAGADDTYVLGESIRVAVSFGEVVTVDTAGGSPTVAIDMDPAQSGRKQAAYESGSGTKTLTFAHVVVEPNHSTQGIAVLADTLELGGGAIRSVATGLAAALGHQGLDHDPAHKVNWRPSSGSAPGDAAPEDAETGDTAPPWLLRGEIDGATATLFFSEALDERFAGGRFNVQVQTSPTGATSFIAAGDVTIDGNVVTVGLGEGNPQAQAGLSDLNQVFYYRPPRHIGGGLRDLAGNPVLTPHSSRWGERTSFVKLDNLTSAAPAAAAPVVTTIAVSLGAGDDGRGDVVGVGVAFSEAVTVTGSPRLRVDFSAAAGDERWARYRSGSGTATLTFAYALTQHDDSDAAIAVPADTLELGGGTIRSAATSADADLAHEAAGTPPDIHPPLLSRTVADGTKLTLVFDEDLEATATPANGAFTVKRTPAGGAEQTVTLRGSPTVNGAIVTLALAQAVRGTDTDLKVSYSKSAAGNPLKDFASNEVTGFNDEPVVNADDTTPPTLERAEINGTTMKLHFSEPLDPASVPVGSAFNVHVFIGDIHELGNDYFVRGSDAHPVTIDGTTVTFTLAASGPSNVPVPVPPHVLVETRYYKPATGNKLRDLAGNEAETSDIKWATNLTSPTLSAATVDGVTLTLVFNEVLDEAASLANSAFTVKKTPQGGTEQTVSLSGTPAIDGRALTLTLADAVAATDTEVKVSYTEPASGTGNRLRDDTGNDIESFSDEPVEVSARDITPPTLERGEIDGGTVTLFFSEALDPDSAGGYFRLKLLQPVGYCIFVPRGAMAISGNQVTVGVGFVWCRWQQRYVRALAGQHPNYAWYVAPDDATANGLRDLAGNEVLSTRPLILNNVTE